MKGIRAYIFGFILSLTLTVGAFAIVQAHVSSGHEFISHEVMMLVLSALAVLQLIMQMIFFLHVGEEEKPRFNLMALSFALVTVGILVGGTLWIMHNLMHMQAAVQPNVFEEENIFPDGHAH